MSIYVCSGSAELTYHSPSNKLIFVDVSNIPLIDEIINYSNELRAKFKKIISDLEVLPIYREYRYNFYTSD